MITFENHHSQYHYYHQSTSVWGTGFSVWHNLESVKRFFWRQASLKARQFISVRWWDCSCSAASMSDWIFTWAQSSNSHNMSTHDLSWCVHSAHLLWPSITIHRTRFVKQWLHWNLKEELCNWISAERWRQLLWWSEIMNFSIVQCIEQRKVRCSWTLTYIGFWD